MHLDEFTLNAWLDDALPAPDRAAAEAHLAACPDCAGRLAELRVVFAGLEAWPEVPLAHDLAPAVVARLSAGPAPAWRPAWLAVLALQAALGLALLWLAAPTVQLSAAGITAWAGGLAAAAAEVASQLEAAVAGFNPAAALAAPLTDWPAAVWSAGLALLGLLWLAGNGLALRRLIRPPTHPGNH